MRLASCRYWNRLPRCSGSLCAFCLPQAVSSLAESCPWPRVTTANMRTLRHGKSSSMQASSPVLVRSHRNAASRWHRSVFTISAPTGSARSGTSFLRRDLCQTPRASAGFGCLRLRHFWSQDMSIRVGSRSSLSRNSNEVRAGGTQSWTPWSSTSSPVALRRSGFAYLIGIPSLDGSSSLMGTSSLASLPWMRTSKSRSDADIS